MDKYQIPQVEEGEEGGHRYQRVSNVFIKSLN